MRSSASVASITAIAACVAAAACTIERSDVRTTSGDAPEADTARVRQTVEAVATALERADFASLDTISDDSILVIVGQEGHAATQTHGWQTYRDQLGGRLGRAGDFQVELHDLRVRLAGSGTALVTCRFAIWQAEELSAQGFATSVFRRAGKNWRLEHVQLSSSKVVLILEQRTRNE